MEISRTLTTAHVRRAQSSEFLIDDAEMGLSLAASKEQFKANKSERDHKVALMRS